MIYELTEVGSLLPGPTARGPGAAYATAVWSGLSSIEADVIDLRVGLRDLDVAAGLALDIRGDWAGERRKGLEDAEYRRIIAGRSVALAGGVVPHAVARGWRALTGDPDALLDEEPGEVLLTSSVTYTVDDAWLARAAVVARDLIGNGRLLYAVVQSPGTFVWGVHSFDDAGFAHDFGSE